MRAEVVWTCTNNIWWNDRKRVYELIADWRRGRVRKNRVWMDGVQQGGHWNMQEWLCLKEQSLEGFWMGRKKGFECLVRSWSSDPRIWGGPWPWERAGYSCISGSLNCALRCAEICRAKSSDVDLHFEVVLLKSVWHSAHKTLRLGHNCCIWGMCYSFVVELNGTWEMEILNKFLMWWPGPTLFWLSDFSLVWRGFTPPEKHN